MSTSPSSASTSRWRGSPSDGPASSTLAGALDAAVDGHRAAVTADARRRSSSRSTTARPTSPTTRSRSSSGHRHPGHALRGDRVHRRRPTAFPDDGTPLSWAALRDACCDRPGRRRLAHAPTIGCSTGCPTPRSTTSSIDRSRSIGEHVGRVAARLRVPEGPARFAGGRAGGAQRASAPRRSPAPGPTRSARPTRTGWHRSPVQVSDGQPLVRPQGRRRDGARGRAAAAAEPAAVRRRPPRDDDAARRRARHDDRHEPRAAARTAARTAGRHAASMSSARRRPVRTSRRLSAARRAPRRAAARDASHGAGRGRARALVELVRRFRALRPAIVHTHNPKPGLYGRVAARVARVPVVVNTVHGLYALPEDSRAKRAVVYGLERVAAACSDAELLAERRRSAGAPAAAGAGATAHDPRQRHRPRTLRPRARDRRRRTSGARPSSVRRAPTTSSSVSSAGWCARRAIRELFEAAVDAARRVPQTSGSR